MHCTRTCAFVLSFLMMGAFGACKKEASPRMRTDEAPLPFDAGLVTPSTTNAGIAMGNLDGTIETRTKLYASSPNDANSGLTLVNALLTRGQFAGRIADYETADALTANMVTKSPKSADAHLARASTAATFHRFSEALTELDAAAGLGASPTAIKNARASIFLAQGRLDEISELGAWQDGADPLSMVSAAAFTGELGRTEVAETLFERARASYRDVSPFTVALTDFQRASLYERSGERAKARAYFTEAVHILPMYAHAVVHLANLLPATEAKGLLTSIASTADDPEVVAALSDANRRTGDAEGATKLADKARARYETLLKAHPEAFYDHGAAFYLGVGADGIKALALAKQNAALRKTAASVDLWLTAAQTGPNANDTTERCAAATAGLALAHASSPFRATATRAREGCP
jgi:tetratricopeptide (TPR) repeat protein